VHGNVRAASVFTSDSGEWKLAGLEILSSMKEDDAVIFTQGSLVPDIGRYSPPEIAKGGWEAVRSNPIHALDSYGYGVLVTEVFNTPGNDQVGNAKNVPTSMQASYKRLSHAVPKMRLSIGHFLEQGNRNGGFFDTPLIKLTDGIENLGLKSDTERDFFLRYAMSLPEPKKMSLTILSELEGVAESEDFPEEFFRVKVVPELLKSVEFGGGGPKPFGIVMRIATKMDEDEYDRQITPVIIRLFSSPDRALRVCLLDNLPLMIDHLSQKIVSDKIFPQMVTGFGDLAPLVREQTVKAVLVVVSKLSDRVVNGELLRHLAKTANDEQPGIRTNTTICLGKIARNLNPSSRVKVLTAAFSRALRDPFVHGRNAALMALAATADMYPEDDCASKMLPAICPCLVDKERMIRDQANKTLNIYLDRIRKYATTLPDTVLPPPQSQSAGPTRIGSPQPSNQWVGWAISSFTNKLGSASGNIEPNSDGTQPTPLERASSTPPANGIPVRPQSHTAPSAPAVPRTSSNLRNSSTAPEVEDEDFGDGWGDMDDTDASVADAWGAEATPTPQDSKPAAPYDDGGEPDFEGWLNAQAASKVKNNKALPKGLVKKAAPTMKPPQSKPRVSTSVNSAGASASKAVAAKKSEAEKKKQPQQQQEVDEDDDWGEAWG